MKKTETKRGRGRPKIDPTGAQRPVSIRVTPTQADYLTRTYGSIAGGVRQLLADAINSSGVASKSGK